MHSGRMILLFVVIALNQYGSMAPTSRPANACHRFLCLLG